MESHVYVSGSIALIRNSFEGMARGAESPEPENFFTPFPDGVYAVSQRGGPLGFGIEIVC